MGSLPGSTARASRTSRPPVVPPLHWKHLNVLVVDDHSAYRLLLGWLLQQLGLGHESAADGDRGLLAFTRRPFDLVISDCRMPVLDGYAMARAIRAHEREHGLRRVPIIALTANLQSDSPQRCRDAGMDAWLLKPVTLEQLYAVLMRWLPGANAPQACQAAPAPRANWPTRATLVATFGSHQVVDQMLQTLLVEAWEDHGILHHACVTLNAPAVAERLHRLVGSLVFLGGADLESTAVGLIEQVVADGVVSHRAALERFQAELRVYLEYLAGI
ncbi:response regulator [Pseudomonas orientalis]|uniref:response regulator n=1 Tax=Pseudomonas orientalis TaxID=76758 RepID=UPI000F58939F|nr:response regulator [Pseudomonas orientalis]AZE87750.1 hypothetical protein C4J97_1033 [Pseudomonas orientalis]